jgi:ERCC4-type nuclease
MDFRIVIDSREQEPWAFDCPTVRRKLEAGDYSVEGLEDTVAVERKSLADFVHTVIHDFDRFDRELQRLAAYEAAAIVVEADLDAVLQGWEARTLRGATPNAVLGLSLKLILSRGVPVYWCGSRQSARKFTERFLRMFVRLRGQTHERECN